MIFKTVQILVVTSKAMCKKIHPCEWLDYPLARWRPGIGEVAGGDD